MIEDSWIDVSFTVKASTLNGGSLMRNTRTGEEKIVTEEDVLDFGQLALDFGDVDPPVPLPMETLTDKAVRATPVKKPRVKK